MFRCKIETVLLLIGENAARLTSSKRDLLEVAEVVPR
jgi:hypothetical protein